MTTLAENLARLTPEQRLLLEAKLRKKGIEIARFQIAPRAQERDDYPLSFAQKRLWFLHQFDPASSVYHISTPMRLRGRIDVASLARALDALVERHEALRTTFSKRGGEPVQIVRRRYRQSLPVIDLAALPRERRELEGARLESRHTQRPFDLERGPLLATALVRMAGDDHSFLLSMHHIVSDGWSLGIFYRELLALYQAFRQGRESPLPPLPVQYVDFALWQDQWFQGEVYETQLAYWKEQLAGLEPVLALPLDRPRPPVLSYRGRVLRNVLPAGRIAPLRDLARAQSATLFAVCLAAWSAVLHRVTGSRDIPIGSPIAGRNRQEVEALIGFFVNTLVLRCDLSGNPSFRQLVDRAREVNAGANSHQDLPFEKLVDELHPERSLQHSPIFQVSLSFQSDPGARARSQLDDVHVSVRQGDNPVAMFDLAMMLTESPQQVLADLIHNTDLFDRTTAGRLHRHLETLLISAAEDPDRRLDELATLGAAERHQLLAEWNDTRIDPPGAAETLASLFELRARAAPELPALVFEGESLSYAELNERANRLARHLRRRGVGPGVPVGVAAERSFEMVVALLGIVKAGGAYVPLDPSYPRERLAFMLDDARIALLLTQAHLHERLGETTAEVVALDADWPSIAEEDAADPEPLAGADDLAYVIYTSGSTGRPKGAMNSHRAIVNRLRWMQDAYLLDASDRVLQKTPFSFDVSVWEFFWPLMNGACLVLARPDGHRDSRYLAELIDEQEITTMHFVPSMLQIFLASKSLEPDGEAAPLASLRRVIVSGEALPAELERRFFARLGAELHNLYGPTEAAVDVTWQACDRRRLSATSTGTVPIGMPIDGIQVHVVDARGIPVAAGVAGELLIGGVGLARGYHRRPALTAEKFIPDHLGGEPDARLYRTGDLVRRSAGGAVEFLGRLDFQVKIRGFRIELGEIEAALHRHESVREVVVVAFAAAPGDQRLAAYLVLHGGESLSIRALREHLAEDLPEHMIPAAFVELEALPLLPNGKVDRRALPAPESGGMDSGITFTAPGNEAERTIAAIWQEVLDIEEVGTRHNFFDLGGHSLLLVQVREKLEEAFGKPISVVDLFRFPTVASLAELLTGVEAPPAAKAEQGRERGRRRAAQRRERSSRERPGRGSSEIAIVGLACRYPGAKDAAQFWRNLRDGVESVHFFSDEELRELGVPQGMIDHPSYVKAAARLEDPELFDAGLFGMSPREAELIDPQQRLFLECAWEVLENAGYSGEHYDGAVGVFAGVGLNFYLARLLADPEFFIQHGFLPITLANAADYLATRLSYKLNLKGPSVAVQTACSTSLVATHLASQSLFAGECDMALAGGVALGDTNRPGYFFEQGGVSSPDGHTRSYDARGQGAVGGSGVGIVVLKRLDRALADGDTIRAVIKGSAINNDGSAKVGFTAPSIEGQSKVIAEALAIAGVEPDTVSYVEGHGTATNLGDPIEVASLREVFGPGPEKRCALGSVKSNIGHTDIAAGVAGLIKTVLALEHRQIPPSLHFEKPNPELGLDESPFYVPQRALDWPSPDGPRRAGVSSFGLGGTNAHVVLEEAPPAEVTGPSRPWQLLVLSAATDTALEAATERLASYLEAHPSTPLADVAFTHQVGRRRLGYRRALVCRDSEDAASALSTRDPQRLLSGVEERGGRPVAFLFPGLGDHALQMGRGLYDTEPTFRREIDRAAEILEPLLGEDLRQVIYPGEAPAPASGVSDMRALLGRRQEPESPEAARLNRTRLAQPAVFAVELALAKLWMEWGLEPEAMVGYSLGEYTAACLAGVFDLDDALALVGERARLIDELPAGAMLAVPLSEGDTSALLADLGAELSVAALNGPNVTVLSGSEEAVAAAEATLVARDLVCQRLSTTHAFHSTMMLPIVETFTERVRRVELRAPRIPYLSNVTGTWITEADATDPEYWTRHLCGTVRFTDNLRELLREDERILLEVGPGQALSTSARQHPARLDGHTVLSSLGEAVGAGGDAAALLAALARLWVAGASLDPSGFWRHERRRRLPLPTYPFERRRYLIEPKAVAAAPPRRRGSGKVEDIADWFYVPGWKASVPPAPIADGSLAEKETWLVFADASGLGARLADCLAGHGQDVINVTPGAPFAGVGEGAATIDPATAGDYEGLIHELHETGRAPRKIVHLWSVPAAGESSFEEIQNRGAYSLLYLSRALASQAMGEDLELTVVSTELHAVGAGEEPCAEKATVFGVLRVIPQEYRNLVCRSIDVSATAAGSSEEAKLAERLVGELAGSAAPEPVVAYRGARRWSEAFEPLPLPASDGPRPGLRTGGVYVLVGGFGLVGRILSRYLAGSHQARLVLTGRTPLPERGAWDEHLGARNDDDAASRRIRHVLELEELGAEVLPVAADVTDRDAMAAVFDRALEHFGDVHGVVYLAGNLAEDKLFVPIQSTGPEVCGWHFESKVRGLGVLAEVLDGRELDFCVVFSSIASILGGLGFAAYAAANTFVDAFVEKRSHRGGFPWLALNWDGWRESAEEEPSAEGGFGASMADLWMKPTESVEAFHRALAMLGRPRLAVAVGDLESRLEQWVRFHAAETTAEGEEGEPASLHPRPQLLNPYVAPASETERSVAKIWQDLLGIDEVGAHDNFFELGGDSLLGTQLMSRLRRDLHVDLPMMVFFQAPTVAKLAEAAEAGREQSEEISEIEAALRAIKGLSAEEIRDKLQADS